MADQQGKASQNDPDGAMMYIACSRCHKIMDVKPGNLNSITHSLCPECFKASMDEIKAFKQRPKK